MTNMHEDEGVKKLLRQALPPVEGGDEPGRGVWPAVLRRINDEQPAHAGWVWLDWALGGALVVMIATFPVSIPVFLYYL